MSCSSSSTVSVPVCEVTITYIGRIEAIRILVIGVRKHMRLTFTCAKNRTLIRSVCIVTPNPHWLLDLADGHWKVIVLVYDPSVLC